MHTTGQISKLLQVNEQTVRRWGAEFSEYLSIHANPDKGKTRLFTDDDLAVFALAADMTRSAKSSYDDIRASLAAGERGVIPDSEIAQVSGRSVALQIEMLTTELKEAQRQIQELEIRLSVSEEQRQEATTRIEELLKRIWELEQGSS